MGKGYDPQCERLADFFLSDEPELHSAEGVKELAQAIQNTIEDYISSKRVIDEAGNVGWTIE